MAFFPAVIGINSWRGSSFFILHVTTTTGVSFSPMKEVVNVFPAVCPTTPPPPKHTLTHAHTLTHTSQSWSECSERATERKRERGRRGKQIPSERRLASSELRKWRSCRTDASPRRCCKRVEIILALLPAFLFHSVALYTSMRWVVLICGYFFNVLFVFVRLISVRARSRGDGDRWR